jgi:hypothetical protein
MGVPVKSGYNSLSGKQIAKIWATRIIWQFYLRTVFAHIANTDFEGEIKDHGDTVVITIEPDVLVNDYVIGEGLTDQRIEPDTVELLINHAKYYSFLVYDVETKQSTISLKFTKTAANALKQAVDKDILNSIPADAAAENSGLTAGLVSGDINLGTTSADGSAAIALTSANVIEYITLCEQVADEQNWPDEDRYMVIPAFMKQKALNSELKDASVMDDGRSRLINGRLGMIGSFTLYQSNQVVPVTETAAKCFNVPFGHKKALTFASQLVKERIKELDDDFASKLQGLHVYGYKVVKPEALGNLYAKRG